MKVYLLKAYYKESNCFAFIRNIYSSEQVAEQAKAKQRAKDHKDHNLHYTYNIEAREVHDYAII